MIKVAAKEWSGETDRTEFYVTSADTKSGIRTIVLQDSQFIGRFEIENGVYFDFPVDDLDVLYTLQAWLFPQNYQENSLNDKRVVMDGAGNIEEVK